MKGYYYGFWLLYLWRSFVSLTLAVGKQRSGDRRGLVVRLREMTMIMVFVETTTATVMIKKAAKTNHHHHRQRFRTALQTGCTSQLIATSVQNSLSTQHSPTKQLRFYRMIKHRRSGAHQTSSRVFVSSVQDSKRLLFLRGSSTLKLQKWLFLVMIAPILHTSMFLQD